MAADRFVRRASGVNCGWLDGVLGEDTHLARHDVQVLGLEQPERILAARLPVLLWMVDTAPVLPGEPRVHP